MRDNRDGGLMRRTTASRPDETKHEQLRTIWKYDGESERQRCLENRVGGGGWIRRRDEGRIGIDKGVRDSGMAEI